jgi:hypothetical protein
MSKILNTCTAPTGVLLKAKCSVLENFYSLYFFSVHQNMWTLPITTCPRIAAIFEIILANESGVHMGLIHSKAWIINLFSLSLQITFLVWIKLSRRTVRTVHTLNGPATSHMLWQSHWIEIIHNSGSQREGDSITPPPRYLPTTVPPPSSPSTASISSVGTVACRLSQGPDVMSWRRTPASVLSVKQETVGYSEW